MAEILGQLNKYHVQNCLLGDNSEHHTRRRENLKSHMNKYQFLSYDTATGN
jgi:hypothetical protein